MDSRPQEPEIFRQLRQRADNEGGVFWTGPDELCVLDPVAARQFNRANFADQTLSDRLWDLLLGRQSAPISWKELRLAWTAQLRTMSGAEGSRRLYQDMERHCAQSQGEVRNLNLWAQDLCGRTLVPWVIDGLSTSELARIHRDRILKADQMLAAASDPEIAHRWHSAWVQINAGWVVRRELSGRARGRRSRRSDLTDPLVDLLPRLGLDRAVDAVTAVLTAVAGPPGSAAACLLYELSRRPRWVARMAEELAPLSPRQLAAKPARLAPTTHGFVKESLRLWSLPLLMVRPVHAPMSLGGEQLKPGQRVLLSPNFMHHDSRHWDRAETFDPLRWQRQTEGAQRSSCPHAAGTSTSSSASDDDRRPGSEPYAPFGWAPRSCLGASLAVLQMMLLCQLFCTRYRIVVSRPEAVQVVLGTVPRVLGFDGTIERR